MDGLRVMLVYPGHTHSTYDVARGYEHALGELGVRVTPFAYHRYLAFYGELLPYWADRHPGYAFDMADVAYHAAAHLVAAVVEDRPDAVLVVCGTGLHRRFYDLMYTLGIPIALLLTESPYEDDLQGRILRLGRVPLAFTNEVTSVPALQQVSPETRVHYLPHAYDPRIHHPARDEGDIVETDVRAFFWGTLWPERRAMFRALEGRGDVRIGGIVPGKGGTLMSNAEVARWYRSVEVVLNLHRRGKGAESLNPRIYEALACGALPLTDYRRELEQFGGAVPTYGTPDELVAQLDHLLTHPDEWRDRLETAREAIGGCTFAKRAERIILPALMDLLGR